MQVSVIIVNYNVKHFLEQCLYSLQKGTLQNIQVIVVDNQSSDGSIEYLQPKFPKVQFLQAGANLGFAKACNKGLQYATGNYILFLNPDTIIAEDTIEKCLHFFLKHSDAGALGVRMLDGSGNFLKESKRAFPAPTTSLFKLFGLSALFPKSKIFSRYYLGHLDAHQNHKVDVLAGAFMMVRKDVLEKVGSFDETFFMYGEDIDLSYRIQEEGGFQNYYLAETEIIHFKGESTKRGSLNYVRMFFQAMSIFVHKHYGGAKAGIFNAAIHFAIWVRALISAVAKLVRWIGLPLIDAVIILFSFWLVKEAWANVVKGGHVYPNTLLQVAFPAFTFVYLAVAYFSGLYNKTFRQRTLVRSSLIALLTLLAGYALLPEHYRFSRGIVLFGSLLSFLLLFLFRLVLLKGKLLQHPPHSISKPYILIAGSEKEFEEVKHILQQQKLHKKIIDRLSIDTQTNIHAMLQNMEAIALASGAKELIMCVGEIPARSVMYLIQHIPVSTWFHMEGSSSIVGSDLSYTSGEVLTAEEKFNLAQPHKKRSKRLVDMITALIFLISFPIHLLVIKKPLSFLGNSMRVLIGRKTWIGYHTRGKGLPVLRQAVVSVLGPKKDILNENISRLDYWYARNYEPMHDVKLILKNYRNLDG
ncbi:glycosyltransferase family 2 protein [Chitinophagaceae bacterium LB-8]|uniref:Glycosyltransferase family 2 protein n=1 Tax=Paraflavisolibacter caeni TaxID=2982496 RepID=A0A9X2XY83_9BACT|nr:glycosyltransferase [Paraflavisolibacter caeni]MCU7550932.1 glycosyltransferase family 2 protein [Paraflavisolibacter caeni]